MPESLINEVNSNVSDINSKPPSLGPNCCIYGRPTAAERVQYYGTLLGAGRNNSFKERNRLLCRIPQALVRIGVQRVDLPHVVTYSTLIEIVLVVPIVDGSDAMLTAVLIGKIEVIGLLFSKRFSLRVKDPRLITLC